MMEAGTWCNTGITPVQPYGVYVVKNTFEDTMDNME